MHVNLLTTCLVDALFPDVARATVRLLHLAGCTPFRPAGQTCCGQPAYNAGQLDDARIMALHTLKVFEQTRGPIILPSGSCAAMIRHGYLHLFDGLHSEYQRAEITAARCFELSEFLADWLRVPLPAGHVAGRPMAYHPSCHLLRGLGVDRQPGLLLDHCVTAPRVDLAPECCGFGGVFSVEQPELSAELLDRKINALLTVPAEVVVGCDVGCLMHIEGGLRARGSKLRCAHLAQVLVDEQPCLG
jgi:L-lactate dehydrogenase complex protein LldE